MSYSKYKWDKEKLNQLYWEENQSIDEIATLYGCCHASAFKAMRRLNIPRRTDAEAQIVRFRIRNKAKYLPPLRKGTESPAWKGGRMKDSNGYIKIYYPEHPYADQRGYICEHRLMMEKKLGRYLLPWEKVHHIDGEKDHNTEDNLQLISPADHLLYKQMCAHCELRKRVRLLEWRIKELEQKLQYKLV